MARLENSLNQGDDQHPVKWVVYCDDKEYLQWLDRKEHLLHFPEEAKPCEVKRLIQESKAPVWLGKLVKETADTLVASLGLAYSPIQWNIPVGWGLETNTASVKSEQQLLDELYAKLEKKPANPHIRQEIAHWYETLGNNPYAVECMRWLAQHMRGPQPSSMGEFNWAWTRNKNHSWPYFALPDEVWERLVFPHGENYENYTLWRYYKTHREAEEAAIAAWSKWKQELERKEDPQKELEAIHAALDKDPNDQRQRYLLAVWYHKQGRKHAAECMRWLAGHNKRPAHYLGSWFWTGDHNPNCVKSGSWEGHIDCAYIQCALPQGPWKELLGNKQKNDTMWRDQPTRREVEEAAVAAWEKWREANPTAEIV